MHCREYEVAAAGAALAGRNWLALPANPRSRLPTLYSPACTQHEISDKEWEAQASHMGNLRFVEVPVPPAVGPTCLLHLPGGDSHKPWS